MVGERTEGCGEKERKKRERRKVEKKGAHEERK